MSLPAIDPWACRVLLPVALLAALACSGSEPIAASALSGQSPLVAAASRATAATGTALGQAHEQEWVVADVVTAIASLASEQAGPRPSLRVETEPGGWAHRLTFGAGAPTRLQIVGHVWSTATYLPHAQQQLGDRARRQAAGRAEDGNARAALVDLRPEVLMDQDREISRRLKANRWSPGAHESAALLVGAFALRETWALFGDSRSELSRMTAHLTLAQALRGGTTETRDGVLARAIHATLAGLQRDALAIVTSLDTPDASAADRAWIRALRLRLTGDWRTPLPVAPASRLELFEHARALRARVGADAMMDWLQTFEQDTAPDWARIALLAMNDSRFTLEAAAVYSQGALDREVNEARRVWSRLQGGRDVSDADLLAALNDAPTPARIADGGDDVVLDWPRWAAALQRHVATALSARGRYHRMRGDRESGREHVDEVVQRFSRLALFPLVLRSVAVDGPEYARSMRESRQLAAARPELITASVWNLLTERPRFAAPAEGFPVLHAWMFPIVPTGTAFDLYPRALQPECPRPPSPQQAVLWAAAQPYEEWTVWSGQWLPATGKPAAAAVIKAFGPLLEYDAQANEHVTSWLDVSTAESLTYARRLCELSSECGRHAWLLLWDGREQEARSAYEYWMKRSRDPLGPANQAEWLARHYLRTGRVADAMRVATFAAGPGSADGLVVLGELLDSLGRHDEAAKIYEAIADRYGNRVPLGIHRLRGALRTGDRDAEVAAMGDLQAVFPRGLEPLALHALDPTPKDGVRYGPIGRRASAIGVQQDDVVVGVDEWRVRDWQQYGVALDVRHDREEVALTVFRNGRYQQLSLRMPERKLGIALHNVARQQ